MWCLWGYSGTHKGPGTGEQGSAPFQPPSCSALQVHPLPTAASGSPALPGECWQCPAHPEAPGAEDAVGHIPCPLSCQSGSARPELSAPHCPHPCTAGLGPFLPQTHASHWEQTLKGTPCCRVTDFIGSGVLPHRAVPQPGPLHRSQQRVPQGQAYMRNLERSSLISASSHGPWMLSLSSWRRMRQ